MNPKPRFNDDYRIPSLLLAEALQVLHHHLPKGVQIQTGNPFGLYIRDDLPEVVVTALTPYGLYFDDDFSGTWILPVRIRD